MSSGSTISASSRPVRACTECKQAKLRCDSKETFPNPCSRCHARHLICTVDSSFQRTPARKRLESMRKELEQLRSQQHGESSATQRTSTVASDEGLSYKEHDVTKDIHDLDLSNEYLRLDDDTVLDSTLAKDALKLFTDLFLPQFPIIGAISAKHMYTQKQLLFWTMVMIVFSHHRDIIDNELYICLIRSYEKRLRNDIVDAPLPLDRIHVLLFLTVWPLPVKFQARDPSWLYCGMAIHASRYLGLDRDQVVPSLRSLGVAAGSADERVSTWLGCFFAATSLSLQQGLRPPIDAGYDLTTIQNLLCRTNLDGKFKFYVRVQIVVAKYASVVSHASNLDACAAIMRLVESELDVLQSAFNEPGSGNCDTGFAILDVKLHFYALLMTKLSPESPSYHVIFNNALTTALRIVQISSLRQPIDSETPEDTLCLRRRSLPKNNYRALAFATILLLKFFYLNSAAPKGEQAAAAAHIKFAQNVFSACSFEDGDEYARAAKVFEALACLNQDTLDSALKLRLTHLMGVSIFLDALSTAAEIRGRPVTIREGETLEDLSTDSGDQPIQTERLPVSSPTTEQAGSMMDFLLEFWDGPLPDLNMADIDYSLQLE